jgi:protein-S-isoprenylcysteine O-methyltransferase Ste14
MDNLMPNEKEKDKKQKYIAVVSKGVVSIFVVLALFFLLAGRLSYWQGWVFGAACLFLVVVQILLFSGKMDLGRERMKPGPGTKTWDKIILALYGPAFFAVFIVACLDAGRYNWTGELSISVYVIGYLLFLFSIFLVTWSMWINRFFSSVVRIQMDRGQHVVQERPYKFIRHPGYVAGILMAISSSLVLGSL